MNRMLKQIQTQAKHINENMHGLYCFGSADAYSASSLDSASSYLSSHGIHVKVDTGMGLITYYVYCKKKHWRKAYSLLKDIGITLSKKNEILCIHNNLTDQ